MTGDEEHEEADGKPDRRKSYALLVDSYVKDLFATGMILQGQIMKEITAA